VRTTATRAELVVWSAEPLLAETPVDLLRDSHVTPTDLFFVRNHGAVPAVDADTYRLRVDGLVQTPLRLSLQELERSFPQATVTATLVCAGNRRAELAAARPVPGEVPWGAGAIGNAVWRGVRLRDVLTEAGIGEGAGHVAFDGHDRTPEAPRFGGSIPLARALGADILLASAMNGQPLTADHGFPLRVVVPGYIGARSVKWLASVVVQEQPSANFFQARGYRLLPSWAAGGDGGIALGELPVNSVLCRAHVSGRSARLEGYAFAGGGRTVERVELSLDDGATWTGAALEAQPPAASWRFWHAQLELRAGRNDVVVRAVDSAASTQPEDAGKLWNPKGYMNNAWHRTVLDV